MPLSLLFAHAISILFSYLAVAFSTAFKIKILRNDFSVQTLYPLKGLTFNFKGTFPEYSNDEISWYVTVSDHLKRFKIIRIDFCKVKICFSTKNFRVKMRNLFSFTALHIWLFFAV